MFTMNKVEQLFNVLKVESRDRDRDGVGTSLGVTYFSCNPKNVPTADSKELGWSLMGHLCDVTRTRPHGCHNRHLSTMLQVLVESN